MNTYNSKLTTNKKIFENTYWGHNCNSNLDILENRNNFIEEFNIVKNINTNIPEKIYKEFDNVRTDHTEIYKTKNKEYVLVNSPYMRGDIGSNIEDKNELLENGWIIYKNLYTIDDSITFIKVIS